MRMAELESSVTGGLEAGRTSTPVRRYRSPADLLLFLEAIALASVARQVVSVPLDTLIPKLASTTLPLRTSRPLAAARAARRAGTGTARHFRWLDTCLTRTLVAASLLDHSVPLTVHLGFRPGAGGMDVEGHAWLNVGGVHLEVTDPLESSGAAYQSAMHIPWPHGVKIT